MHGNAATFAILMHFDPLKNPKNMQLQDCGIFLSCFLSNADFMASHDKAATFFPSEY